MLPNWIIVGAPKAGTSSLFRWIADHPDAAGSAEKETYYFVDPGTHMYRARSNWATRGIEGYQALFAHCASDARVILEATPAYMYAETALRELPNLPSCPRFIFVLREPVEQIKSLYGYFKENWSYIPGSMSFREFVAAADGQRCTFNGNELARSALTNADYLKHLRRWRDICGPDRMHVFLFEDMIKHKRTFMTSLAQLLELSPEFYDSYEFPVENASYRVRSRVAQRLNIRVRAAIPKGAVYDGLRRVYRGVNTRPAGNRHVRDLEVERMLAKRYAGTMFALEREFGLDTRCWRDAASARTAN